MKKFLVMFLMCFVIFLSACAEEYFPLCVSFKNQTLLNSPYNTLFIVYAEDKRVREFSTDVFVKSNIVNHRIIVRKELGESYEFIINTPNSWMSLSQLCGNLPLPTFARVESTSLIFETFQKGEITIKVVGGVCEYNLITGESKLLNPFDASKEFTMLLNQLQ